VPRKLEPFARTADGMAIVYHRTTGEQFIRWPIDAREMIESGHYSAAPPKGVRQSQRADVAEQPDIVREESRALTEASDIPRLPLEIEPGVPANYSRGQMPVTGFIPPSGRTPKKAS
jgi:hypothetical protein